jgi:hypothetical protein
VNNVTLSGNCVTPEGSVRPTFVKHNHFKYSLIKIMMKKAGIVIMIIGLLLTLFTAFSYFTREKVVDLGNVEIISNKKHVLTWSPVVGIAALVIGITLFAIPSKKGHLV